MASGESIKVGTILATWQFYIQNIYIPVKKKKLLDRFETIVILQEPGCEVSEEKIQIPF